MSHLPLDARAILQYLNELGYRNISAEQLKEFMKGMQRQSEITSNNSSSRSKIQQQKPKASSSSNTTQQQQQKLTATPSRKFSARVSTPKPSQSQTPGEQAQPQRLPVKIIKSKKPLINFKFYLDICDHQQTKKIEDKVKQLGGNLEFFLTPSVTHFITDKTVLPPTVSNNNNTLSSRPGTPQTPYTPHTPPTVTTPQTPDDPARQHATTPSSVSTRRAGASNFSRQTRADAILNRARLGGTPTPTTPTTTTRTTTPLKSPNTTITSNNKQQPYVVWQTEQALRFFAKVQNDLKDILATSTATAAATPGGARKTHHHHHHHSSKSSSSSSRAFGPTYLKGNFIKIESLKHNYRPYYQLFKKPAEWPKIELTREDGAFRLSPKQENEPKIMTRKSRSRSSQRQQHKQQQQQQQPQDQPVLPAAVQALKKTTINSNTAAGDNNSFKSSGPVQKGHNTASCKQGIGAGGGLKESSDKQCGVCEICKIEYDTLTIHLKTKDHEFFAKNSQNFVALDSLIHSSADVNKFLEEEKRQEMELEEMEVEEQADSAEINIINDPSTAERGKHNSAPSPTTLVREKSKRSTKGKHSSEKFQQIPLTTATTPPSTVTMPTTRRSSKSPKSLLVKSSSPKKQQATTLKLQINCEQRQSLRNKSSSNSAANVAAGAVYSPPMRAMLPPSSMYKVVDATITTNANNIDAGTTTLRSSKSQNVGAATNATASPLIVKFRKVRETELCRLSGEADRFMFRKQRTSSDLPTDLDRQTTSEHLLRTQHSSTSLESSFNDVTAEEAEKTDFKNTSAMKTPTTTATTPTKSKGKAIAIARRRKGAAKEQQEPQQQRHFPNAPIQPAIQQLKQTITDTTATHSTASTTSRLSLPAATRKSSRTATAIVTAATTSSHLLRAAVEAAKKAGNGVVAANNANNDNSDSALNNSLTLNKKTRSSRLTVAKMEDRMGEMAEKQTYRKNSSQNTTVDDDDDEDDLDLDLEYDDEVSENDDADKDKDFIINTKLPKLQKTSDLDLLRHSTREERAARRWTQRFDDITVHDEAKAVVGVESEEKIYGVGRRRKLQQEQTPKTPKSNKKPRKSGEKSTPNNAASKIKKLVLSSPPQRHFDIMKSQRLSKLRYAFERLPVTDIWYRVYSRQDACEERYFEYYGSTDYRKLPYEMGPIPFDYTLNGKAAKCCKLCQAAGKVPKMEPITTTTNIETNIKKEKEVMTNKMETETTITSTTTLPATSTSNSYTHKHKKLHLLQRYHQELLQEEQQKHAENQLTHQNHSSTPTAAPTTSSSSLSTSLLLKCDSKASTPEREIQQQLQQQQQQRIVRAGSTQSNTSSCTVSSAGTLNSQNKYRNKHLNKAASLELPPRKSPREHASTLALVSCIIRQRQDSLSKTNSETDEPTTPLVMPKSPTPATTTMTALPSIEDDVKSIKAALLKQQQNNKTPNKNVETSSSTTATTTCNNTVERCTRSAAVTPVEELRFATEISENVKRMRRGQNKYDHSPPIVLKTKRSTRGKCKATSPSMDRNTYRATTAISSPPQQPQRTPTRQCKSEAPMPHQRRRPRSLWMSATTATTTTTAMSTSKAALKSMVAAGGKRNNSVRRRIFNGGRPTTAATNAKSLKSQQPSIRKTGCKKGVLEFEVETSALRALKAAMAPKPSPYQLEWEIDKYLELAGKTVDCVEEELKAALPLCTGQENEIPQCTAAGTATTSTANARTHKKTATKTHKATTTTAADNTANTATTTTAATTTTTDYSIVNTPPPTDCFSSDFDLYELIPSNDASAESCGGRTTILNGGQQQQQNVKSTNFSLYSSVALQNYFRRRKAAKSNRTGWPKAQKKKTSLRQQHLLRRQRTRYLPNGEIMTTMMAYSNAVTKPTATSASANNNIKDEQIEESTPDLSSQNDEQSNEAANAVEQAEAPDNDGVDGGVITPPESDVDDDNATVLTMNDENYEEDDEAEENDDDDDDDDGDDDEDNVEFLDAIDDTATNGLDDGDIDDDDDTVDEDKNQHIEDETIADSIEIERCCTADLEIDAAAEADIEADEDENIDEDIEFDDDTEDDSQAVFNEQRNSKRLRVGRRRSTERFSPHLSKAASTSLTSTPTKASALTAARLTTPSTPTPPTTTSTTGTANMLRGLRRTPTVLLNGTLGSCISPSEKAGDNSDIFTVSSDGLDTDVDLSNSFRSNHDDETHQHNHHQQHNHQQQHNSSLLCPHRTPKRKYDISKYAPNNKNARTCAAEAATAAVKSLAISQFLKKEVRVTCRRLRPPFRRFRFRR